MWNMLTPWPLNKYLNTSDVMLVPEMGTKDLTRMRGCHDRASLSGALRLPTCYYDSFPRKVIVYICIILIMSSDDQGDFQCYTLRSRKISKPRDLYLELFDSYEIWQVSRQLCCQSACPISKQHANSNYLCRCFEAWWGFTLKQLSLQWRHNEGDGVSNQQPHECLLKRLFRRRSKKNIKAPRHRPLWGEFTGDRWIPRTKGQLRGKCFHLMTSPCIGYWTGPWQSRLDPGCHWIIIVLFKICVARYDKCYTIDSRYIAVIYNTIVSTKQ